MSRFNAKRFCLKSLLPLILMVMFLGCGAVTVQASKTDMLTNGDDIRQKDPTLILTQSMAEIVDVQGDIADVMVADSSIVSVNAIQSNRLYLVGVNVGSTNIIALDAKGDVIKRLNVHVKIDDVTLQNALDKLFPDEDISVTTLTDQLILTGTVSTPSVAEKVTNVVGQYMGEIQNLEAAPDAIIVNLLKVRGDSQVTLQVKVLEVRRNALKELSLEPEFADWPQSFFGADLTANPAVGALNLNNGAALSAVAFGQSSLLIAENGGNPLLSVLIQALEDRDFARTLAEPNLTAISGQDAGFLAGGEVRFLAGFSATTGAPEVDVMDVGVSLSFRPTVLSGEMISLQLNTEVAELAPQLGTTAGGVNLPGRTVKRANTTVEMPSGSTLMIAGLISSNLTKNVQGLPGVSDLPILGDLISSKSFDREETEVLIVVTPVLVKPFAENNKAEVVKMPEPVSDHRHRRSHSRILSEAFASNIRKIYKFKDDDYLSPEGGYGYILD